MLLLDSPKACFSSLSMLIWTYRATPFLSGDMSELSGTTRRYRDQKKSK